MFPFFGYLDKRCNLTSISTNLGQLALLNSIQRLGLGEEYPKLFMDCLWWNSRPHFVRDANKEISLGRTLNLFGVIEKSLLKKGRPTPSIGASSSFILS
jgi:hypothetical protein